MVNAPTRQWITDAMPDYRQGGRVYGDYPQVDITGATTLVADRLAPRAKTTYCISGSCCVT